ncbi:MAG: response regulator [Pyrinomonadaceae bacterium]
MAADEAMINCPTCGHDNPVRARFCANCGRDFQPEAAAASGPATGSLELPPLPDFSPSSPPDGSTLAELSVPLPAAPPAFATTPLAIEGSAQEEFKPDNFLVLVVDDMVDNLVILSLHLQQVGYRVVTAADGEQAIQVATVSEPDLILMDIGMPGLDGLGATRQLREHETLSKVPVIAITAFGTDGFRRAAYDVGIDGYLTKPIDFKRLDALMQRLLLSGSEQ